MSVQDTADHPASHLLEPLQLGSVTLPNRLILAPMAGVTDRPFRTLCRELGAGLTIS
ncbi:MAG: tRNA dihydrouridine synthase DusB, partial [Gammaproteobacteria bacterium]|nr:tRNA dihydrouridine synthase DusB [Gammaproteobacteria bacterium]